MLKKVKAKFKLPEKVEFKDRSSPLAKNCTIVLVKMMTMIQVKNLRQKILNFIIFTPLDASQKVNFKENEYQTLCDNAQRQKPSRYVV